MALIVRDAVPEDVSEIYALGRSDAAFRVSEAIHFYEERELSEWIARPEENILCVVLSGSEIIGFCFCKIMSYHWAMLDNFYVKPGSRGGKAGPVLFSGLVRKLQAKGISYVSTLVGRNRVALRRLMCRYGFKHANSYEWYELFLIGGEGSAI